MRTVLVTGAAGFIGRRVVESLGGDPVRVVALDKSSGEFPGATVVRIDLRDREGVKRVLQEHRPDTIVHLAAQTDLVDDRGLEYYDSNTRGVSNLLDAMAAVGGVERAICTSSQLVCRTGTVPKHDTDYSPTNLYGESKVLTERIWREADGAGTTWAIVRPTTVWGPYMNAHYARFFRLLSRGLYVHMGNSPVWKSYGFVGNVVYQLRALCLADSARIHGRVFYLADYEPVDLRRWIDAFQGALNSPRVRTIPIGIARPLARVGDVMVRLGVKSAPLTSFRLANLTTPSVIDMAATREVCGPLPFSFDAGVAETTIWLRGRDVRR